MGTNGDYIPGYEVCTGINVFTSYAICTGVPHFPLSFIAAFFLRHVFNRSLMRTLSGNPPRLTTVFCERQTSQPFKAA